MFDLIFDVVEVFVGQVPHVLLATPRRLLLLLPLVHASFSPPSFRLLSDVAVGHVITSVDAMAVG